MPPPTGRGFGNAPIEIELRMSVQDSPNSAGVVIDAVRCAKLGLERGIGGPLEAPSAYYMKSPPKQMRDSVACELTDAFIQGNEADEGTSQGVLRRPRLWGEPDNTSSKTSGRYRFREKTTVRAGPLMYAARILKPWKRPKDELTKLPKPPRDLL